jgi:hypothetical protein
MEIINKIAFLVHEPGMYAHYSSVWAQMKQEDFVIVLLLRCEIGLDGDGQNDVKAFIDEIDRLGYEIDYFSEIVNRGDKYKYVVSNHCMGKIPPSRLEILMYKIKKLSIRTFNSVGVLWHRKKQSMVRRPVQYLPLQIGVKQIRFMYGADIGDGWSLQGWNRMYDLFLCHGPNDVAELKKRFEGKTEIMGYPRYDEYFNQNLDTSGVVKEFGIDPAKKTILWMATAGEGACSIPHFAELISGLMKKFNVIVRPHPSSFRDEPEYIDLLRSLNYTIDSNSLRDMNKLYKAVDVVLCDYGGSPFGAIYLDKKLILLDVENAESFCTVINSSNLQLRKYFPVIRSEEFCNISSLIDDEQLWDDQIDIRRMLFSKYFADNRGESSRRAAEILSNLDVILN